MTGASQSRVTLNFASDSGRAYLYDDVTGNIYPWTPTREAILRSDLAGSFEDDRPGLCRRFGEPDVDAAHRFVRHWRDRYGAFSRPIEPDHPVRPISPSELEAHIRSSSFALTLILTENCNLRCGYCSLSQVYPLNRVRSERQMTLETARRAIDWYAELTKPQIARNPRGRLGLSLYGGEPLLNAPVLRAVLKYSSEKYPGLFVPVMTTNGTALTPRNVETLVKHDVLVGVSIDGPAREHDRMRVDSRSHGTFARILKNLRYIKERHPDYWKSRLTAVSVYDWGTDLEAVEEFFRENEDIIPRSVFVSQVGGHNTDWYSRYTARDAERANGQYEHLRQKYKQAKINGERTSHYLECLVGAGTTSVILRRRALDARPDFLPFTGACVPGSKLAVHVDGTIDMCERVNGRYPIGHLDQGGIDYGRIGEIIEAYRHQVMGHCRTCASTKHCATCFSNTDTTSGFATEAGQCASIAEGAKRRMADYMSILEANASADFSFETGTSMLEQRMLFQC